MFLKIKNLVHHVNIIGEKNENSIVLIHSLGTDSHIWDYQIDKLIKNHQLVLIDIRGHGLTETDNSFFSIDDLANDVILITKQIGIDKFSIAGVSIGGLIAQRIAETNPSHINSITLIDTCLQPDSEFFWKNRSEDIRKNGLKHLIDDIYSRWITKDFICKPEGVGMLNMLKITSSDGYAGCCYALAQEKINTLEKPNIPTLVFVGENDTVYPIEKANMIAKAWRGELIILKNAAHIPNIEKHEEINSKMIGFLNKNRC